MKPRDRKTAAGLLPRMEARLWKDGKTVTYRYHPVGGTPIQLGTDRAGAIQKVLDLNRTGSDVGTVAELWRLYQKTDDWNDLAQATRDDYTQCSLQLLPRFGKARAAMIRPTDVNRYLRVERADAPVRANREHALLSNLLKLAVSRGDMDENPCRQVSKNKERPRTEAPERAALEAFVGWLVRAGGQRLIIAQMAEFAAYGGNRRVEFLELTWPQVDLEAGVIRIKRAKQRDREVWETIAIGPQMAELLDRIEKVPGRTLVFANRKGNAYGARSFMTNWGRWMLEAIEAGVVTRRFTFHDLRAYYVTLHRNEHGGLPDLHKNPATTARIYDRRKESKRGAM